MRITFMCPKCGDIIFPYTVNNSNGICDFCGTKRINVNEDIQDSQINYDSDRELLVQRIYRKYLFNNPEFNEDVYEERVKKRNAFKESIHEYVSNLPHCPTCGSTDIRHIGTGERAISVIGLGLFSGKIGKNYECLNCRARW